MINERIKYMLRHLALFIFLSSSYTLLASEREEEYSFYAGTSSSSIPKGSKDKKKVQDDREEALISFEEKVIDNEQHPFSSSSLTKLREEAIEMIEENIKSYLIKYLINNEKISEPALNKAGRNSLKIIAGIFGSTAGVPYINISCKAGQAIIPDSLILCSVFSSASVISFGSASAWTGLRLAGHLDPLSPEEISLQLKEQKKYKVITHILANTLGVISSLPTLYYVYKYNDTHKWLAIPATIISYFYESQGYYALFERLPYLRNLNFSKPKDPNRFPSINISEKIQDKILSPLFRDLDTSIEQKKRDVVLQTKELLEELRNYPISNDQDISIDQKGYAKFLKKSLQVGSLIFPIGNSIVSSMITHESLELIVSSPYFSWPSTALVVAPTFVLDSTVMVRTVEDLFDKLYNKIYGQTNKGYVETFFPKTTKVLPLTCFILAALSSGTDFYAVHDITSDLSILQYILPVMAVVNITIFETYTSYDLGKDLIRYISKLWGSSYRREILNISEHVERIQSMLQLYFDNVLKPDLKSVNIGSNEVELKDFMLEGKEDTVFLSKNTSLYNKKKSSKSGFSKPCCNLF